MTQSSEKRRHRRLAVRLPVTLVTSTGSTQMMTDNISTSGLFLRTDTPDPLRRLVKIKLTTPDTHEDLEMLAMVVYTVMPEQTARFGKTPGMGLNLYGLNDKARQTWTAFVRRSIDLHEEARLQELVAIEGDIEPIRRRFPRFEAEFLLRVETVDALYDLDVENISAGGAFISTGVVLPGGTDLKLTIVHPEDGSEFTLKGQVVRATHNPQGSKGLAVSFQELDRTQHHSFMRFIESGLPLMEVEADLIIEGHDDLLE